MWLTRFSIQRPIIVAMLFVALAVYGLASYFALGKNSSRTSTSRSSSFSRLSRRVAGRDGALVIKPIEDQVDGIEHLDTMSATAQEAPPSSSFQFKLGTNLDFAAIDVQRRVDTARFYLPTDLDPPQVSKAGANEAVVTYAIDSKTLSAEALADVLNDRVISDIRHIPNVEK